MKTIKIGDQIWCTENLDINKFRNGDIIFESKTDDDWKTAGNKRRPSWRYSCYNLNNKIGYGKLYNWYAVSDSRILAPEGFHVPTMEEFELLRNTVNGNGNSLKVYGEGSDDGVGTNESGFSAMLSYEYDHYWDSNEYMHFWSLTSYNSLKGYNMLLDYYDASIYIYDDDKRKGYSVRLIKD